MSSNCRDLEVSQHIQFAVHEVWEAVRHYVRVVKEIDSKSIGLCPQGFKSPWCRFSFAFFHLPFFFSWSSNDETKNIAHWSSKKSKPLPGLEPGISCSVGRRLIRWAIRAIRLKNHATHSTFYLYHNMLCILYVSSSSYNITSDHLRTTLQQLYRRFES